MKHTNSFTQFHRMVIVRKANNCVLRMYLETNVREIERENANCPEWELNQREPGYFQGGCLTSCDFNESVYILLEDFVDFEYCKELLKTNGFFFFGLTYFSSN